MSKLNVLKTSYDIKILPQILIKVFLLKMICFLNIQSCCVLRKGILFVISAFTICLLTSDIEADKSDVTIGEHVDAIVDKPDLTGVCAAIECIVPIVVTGVLLAGVLVALGVRKIRKYYMVCM